MCCFVILLLSNEMQMSVRRFSAIPHLRGQFFVRFSLLKTDTISGCKINKIPTPQYQADLHESTNQPAVQQYYQKTINKVFLLLSFI